MQATARHDFQGQYSKRNKNTNTKLNSEFALSTFDRDIEALNAHFWVNAYTVSSRLRYVEKKNESISGEEMHNICRKKAFECLGKFVGSSRDSKFGSSSTSGLDSSSRSDETFSIDSFDLPLQEVGERQRENKEGEGEGGGKEEQDREGSGGRGRDRGRDGTLNRFEILTSIFSDLKKNMTVSEKISSSLLSSFSCSSPLSDSTSPSSLYPVHKLIELSFVKEISKADQNSMKDMTFKLKKIKKAPKSTYGPLLEEDQEAIVNSKYDTVMKKDKNNENIEDDYTMENWKYMNDDSGRESERIRAIRREEEEKEREREREREERKRDRDRDRDEDVNNDTEKLLYKISDTDDFDLFKNKNNRKKNLESTNALTHSFRKKNIRSKNIINNNGIKNDSENQIRKAFKSLLSQLAKNCFSNEDKKMIIYHLSSYLHTERQKPCYNEGKLRLLLIFFIMSLC